LDVALVNWRAKNISILILPRTRVLERTYVLPTDRDQDVTRILKYRLSSETPFLMRDLDWSWRIVGKDANGEYLIKVALVEKSRLRKYLEQCELPRQPVGVLVEDDFLAAYQSSCEREGAPGVTPEQTASPPQSVSQPSEVHLYSLQQRLLASLVKSGSSLRSNVTSLNGHEVQEIGLQEVLTPLIDQTKSSPEAGGSQPQPIQIRWDSGLQAKGLHVDPALGFQVGAPIPALKDTLRDGAVQDGAVHGGTVQEDAARESDAALGDGALRSLPEGGWILEPDKLKDPDLARWVRQNATKGLLPESWRAEQRGRKLLMRLLLICGGIVLACLAARITLSSIEAKTRGDRLAVEEQRRSLRLELREVEAAQMLINRLEAGSGSTRQILSAWDRIAQHVPRDMKLTSLVFQENGVLILHGTTKRRTDIGTLIEALAADPSQMFRDVTLGGLEERRDQEQIFNIRALVRGGVEKESPQ
jgi:hypothetical protein